MASSAGTQKNKKKQKKSQTVDLSAQDITVTSRGICEDAATCTGGLSYTIARVAYALHVSQRAVCIVDRPSPRFGKIVQIYLTSHPSADRLEIMPGTSIRTFSRAAPTGMVRFRLCIVHDANAIPTAALSNLGAAQR